MIFPRVILVALLGATNVLASVCICGNTIWNGKTWTQRCCEENGGKAYNGVFVGGSCELSNAAGFQSCCGRLGGGGGACV
jgi:hypothetical protein